MLTLLTDFGVQDGYVGILKGAIASIAPHCPVIDLTHQIPPQNIAAARFCLLNAYRYFPPGTVHVAVVDPGVGSDRRAVAIQIQEGWLVGPDNGLFSGVLQTSPPLAAVVLNHPHYWRTLHPSTTFHGRDIFAPVGAHLSLGVPLTELGDPIDPTGLITLPLPAVTADATGLQGTIQHIDHFGNLITTIPGERLRDRTWEIQFGDRTLPAAHSYSDQPWGSAIALIGSHGWVEITINGGNAQAQLQGKIGAECHLIWLDDRGAIVP
ncbi:SAM-dependent chlorinase/fluorinase [Spirulina major CS-329]|uniref:SAM hydrolase/SAM-dependent halogenase family protein n=1 Tax=Spirulina TaxID=1154 RepID=UPI00232D50A3|nr:MULTISPECIES: SAM-dependent chlorinase/fluorinase [Spirulina]MDB9494011.1 SAM-dependent chlorinase/fluorinase [Spirulina subsalsa CS-330]MDB9502223.1 SAM-dependent chlorinase/fluorinase [Spirulina major CS-329]